MQNDVKRFRPSGSRQGTASDHGTVPRPVPQGIPPH